MSPFTLETIISKLDLPRIRFDELPPPAGCLSLVAPFDDYTGYGLHATYLVTSALDLGYAVEAKPTRTGMMSKRVQDCFRAELNPERHTLLLETPRYESTPDYWFTMHETTRLPDAVFERLRRANHVIVPSRWNADCFSAQGITRPIHVCPLGYNANIFVPAKFRSSPCIFGMLGNPSLSNVVRKNFDFAIKAFRAAFAKGEDARLWIKQLKTCPAVPDTDARIIVSAETWTEAHVAEWYQSITALVMPSRCEAWGFPALQAMACGRPVIAARYAGLADYLTDENSYAIDYQLTAPKRAYDETGLWAEPDFDSLVDCFRRVYNNVAKAENKGIAAATTASRYTWDAVNDKLFEILAQTGFFEPLPKSVAVPELPPPPPEPKPELFKIESPTAWNPAPLPVRPGPCLKAVQYCTVCFVHLGRYGDILNILPVLKHVYDSTGRKPTLLVSNEFRDVEQWASYFNVEGWDGHYLRVKPAALWARRRFASVVVSQPCGEDHMLDIQCESFTQEAWRAAGCAEFWGKLPLVLDMRNQWREAEVIRQHVHSGKPVIVLALSSHSSPFEKADEIREYAQQWQDCQIVDLSGVRVQTLIDLLGLLDRAACLITVDSALLHLAAASKVPVVAFITDKPSPWNGTKPRCNIVHSQRYDEPVNFNRLDFIFRCLTRRAFRLVYSEYEPSAFITKFRHADAKRTWPMGAPWLWAPVFDGVLQRQIDGKPHLRDVIEAGSGDALLDDVIVYINRDIGFSADAPDILRREFLNRDCLYAFRRDVMGCIGPVSSADLLKSGIPYDGCDLFAFTRRWWLAHRDEMPDFVIGAPEWDRVLRRLMESVGRGPAGFDGLIVHEWHDSAALTGADSEATKQNVELAARAAFKPRKSRFGKDVDAIRRFYRQKQPPPKNDLIDFSQYALSTNPQGIGDVVLLTPLPKISTEQGRYCHIFHPAEHFKTLMRFNHWYRPYDGRMTVSADLLQTTFKMGNGHLTQRLQRAFGFEPMRLPGGIIDVPGAVRVPGRCMLHFDPGPHAGWQREHLHHRAREVYPHNLSLISDFCKRHVHDMEFYEVGRTYTGLEGTCDFTNQPLGKTIEFLATCEWFIGIISGPMHVATALGVKCVVLINFPHADEVYLPVLVDINQVESEWFYPQNVHLHQDGGAELVRQFSVRNLELALEGGIYPYWSHDYLDLINEPL